MGKFLQSPHIFWVVIKLWKSVWVRLEEKRKKINAAIMRVIPAKCQVSELNMDMICARMKSDWALARFDGRRRPINDDGSCEFKFFSRKKKHNASTQLNGTLIDFFAPLTSIELSWTAAVVICDYEHIGSCNRALAKRNEMYVWKNDKSRAEHAEEMCVVEWVKASAARSREIFNYHYKMGVISWLTRVSRWWWWMQGILF